MTACPACATELQQNAKFCHSCGSPITAATRSAEYKQVTVLFADVVHSMDLAAAVGAERLRELMTELFDRCASVVQRYGGTVDKFTGDGMMAVFGAPVALEDHAFRACLAALEIQQQTQGLANEIQRSDGVLLQLRVGLNSGQVIAGKLGSNPLSYTAIGEQVGMAQRMESVAPPGGVMLSESTARLVEDVATLGERELVQIKGTTEPVWARRLLAASSEHRQARRQDPSLVGRSWEMGALTGILDQAIGGTGCVVGIVGPPGIGKSRIAREVTAVARSRDVEVFISYCESHASEIPFHAVTSLLRTTLRVSGVADEVARARVRQRAPDADPQDLLLLEDLLAIRDSGVELPAIDPDARRRRLTRLVNTISLTRQTPGVYIVEDAHWIDEVSELLLADFLTVIRQTPSLMLITYRPEYRGALTRTPNSQTITLAPLNGAQTSTLAAELLGESPSVTPLVGPIAERAAGNPFFAEEMVRDLAERGVLIGARGNYVCHVDRADVVVPATLQATIAARIDRLAPAAKQTLNGAAVIGLRFSAEQLALLDDEAEMGELIAAELIDQVRFTPYAEYAFHHPLVQIVAYESQLKSGRARLHRRLATAIEQRHPDALEENAALIAEHLEAAEALRAAFDWHMRAGTWAQYRDITAARVSWERARQVADRLPDDDQDRMSMRIAPRTLLCGSAWHIGGSVADAGFDELRELTTLAGDQVSLAIGMAGLVASLTFHSRYRESSRLASECVGLLESIGDPTLTVGLLYGPTYAKLQAGEVAEVLRVTQRIVDLADGDPAKGNLIVGSPLALAIAGRAAAKSCLGMPGWSADFDNAIAMARGFDSTTYVIAVWYKYGTITNGMVLCDSAALRETAQALQIAEQSADDFTLSLARLTRGLVLIHQDGSEIEQGFQLLAQARAMALQERFTWTALPIIDTQTAKEKARAGDVDGAVDITRAIIDDQFDTGEMMWRGPSTNVLVESLLRRGGGADLRDARAAIDRLAAAPTDPGFVLHELPLLRLRALMARATGDEKGYRDFADRYLKRATDVGYEGHMALAEAMT